MSAWNDRDRWAALGSGTACPICSRGALDVVAKLEACWVTMQEAAPVTGYVCLVSQAMPSSCMTCQRRVPRHSCVPHEESRGP